MTGKINPFAPRPRGGAHDAIERITDWVHAALPEKEADALSITELACAEPHCPPRETVIIVMPTAGSWLKMHVHRAMRDVTEEDVRDALQTAERVDRKTN